MTTFSRRPRAGAALFAGAAVVALVAVQLAVTSLHGGPSSAGSVSAASPPSTSASPVNSIAAAKQAVLQSDAARRSSIARTEAPRTPFSSASEAPAPADPTRIFEARTSALPPSQFESVNAWTGPDPANPSLHLTVYAGRAFSNTSTTSTPALLVESYLADPNAAHNDARIVGVYKDSTAQNDFEVVGATGGVLELTPTVDPTDAPVTAGAAALRSLPSGSTLPGAPPGPVVSFDMYNLTFAG